MRKFSVVFQGRMVDEAGHPLRSDTAEVHLDQVLTELEDIGAQDAAMGASLATGEVEISVTVDADSLEGAQNKGSSVIRTAIHAAGGATPEWSIDWCRVAVQRFDLV